MTLYAIAVPKWGLAMEEGTLTSWLIEEGANVAVGAEIAEIETSKIANVLEAQSAGILRRRVAGEGDVKPVGALLGVVADAGEDESAIDAFVADYEARFATEALEGPTRAMADVVDVDGRPLRFLKLAASGERPGAPMVLLHGFGGDHLNWMFNQQDLAQDRDVYALDLPGHGGSSKEVGDGSLNALADTVAAWLDLQDLGPVHLVGHSMGAGVALSLALNAPERVKSLIALCGAGFGGALNRDYVEGFIAAQKRRDLTSTVELLFADPGLVTREMLDDLIASKRIDGATEALRLLIDNALSEPSMADLEARRDQMAAPKLAIYGAQDQVMRTPAHLPDGAVVIEAAGHMPHLEAATAVNAHIAAFARDHDAI